ncbi:MAG: hypothetical protein ACREK5_00685 [Gemmatimonadota bacterium]
MRMRYAGIPLRRLAAMAITLGLLSAFVAEQKAAESARGPILTACADPLAAASDGAARLLLDGGPVFDWSLRPTETLDPARALPVDRSGCDVGPDPRPPRFPLAI